MPARGAAAACCATRLHRRLVDEGSPVVLRRAQAAHRIARGAARPSRGSRSHCWRPCRSRAPACRHRAPDRARRSAVRDRLVRWRLLAGCPAYRRRPRRRPPRRSFLTRHHRSGAVAASKPRMTRDAAGALVWGGIWSGCSISRLSASRGVRTRRRSAAAQWLLDLSDSLILPRARHRARRGAPDCRTREPAGRVFSAGEAGQARARPPGGGPGSRGCAPGRRRQEQADEGEAAVRGARFARHAWPSEALALAIRRHHCATLPRLRIADFDTLTADHGLRWRG
jgi:hypothetical protein